MTATRTRNSGLIACFAAGFTFGGLVNQHADVLLCGAKDSGNLLALLTWVMFRAADTENGRAPGVSTTATVRTRPTKRQDPDVVSRPQMNIESRRRSKNAASISYIPIARGR